MRKQGEIKTLEPNVDYVEMTRMIIKQNDEILRINRVLIEHFSNPVLYVNTEVKLEEGCRET